MIVQEPVQAAIWHCLNHYAYTDATFLAERLCAEVETEESLFLLATCYYRSGQLHQAHWLLSTKGAQSPQCKFLLAKCAFELKLFSESEHKIINDDHLRSKHLDEVCKEFGDIACFALQLISKICTKTERITLANEACRKAVKLNPFLWQSFADLCNRGDKPDPNAIFQLTSTDIFQTSHGHHNSVNSMVWFGSNGINNATTNGGNVVITNDYPLDILNSHLSTPVDQVSHCLLQNMTNTPNNYTNNVQHNNSINLNNTMTSLRGGNNNNNNFNIMNEEQTPRGQPTPNNDTNMSGTPFRRQQFKYLQSLSPTTPSFGVLPIIHSPNINEQSGIMIMTPSPQPPNLQGQPQNEQNDLLNSNKKMRGPQQIMNVKATLLQQQSTNTTKPVFSLTQTGNQLTTPRTPNSGNLQGQNVRRSSRLFSNNNISVKENSKSPQINNKFVAPRSPPRKSKTRLAKNSNATLSELNEKKEKEKIETITSNDILNEKVFLNNSINSAQKIAQHVLQLKKQSADGLMTLLRDLGQGYVHLQSYETQKAIKCFSTIPPHHYNSSWVKSMVAIAHHEQREYDAAVNIFREIHDKEPYRLQFMEIYSTDLWHLQKDVVLSALAQDLMAQDKNSPVTWTVAGNCFSAHKEHETAIKFFQRAIQVDPDFAYSYTLLGHELVMTEELDKALSCFRTAILKDPRHYNAWYGIGTIFSKQERYQLAEIHYRRALQINPKNSVIMVHIGVMQFYLQKTEQSLQTLNTSIAIDPKNPLCKFHRGSMYFSMGRYQEALRELEELKQIVPKESVVYYLIGKIHKKLGNVDLALMNLSWATDLGSKGPKSVKDNFDAFTATTTTASNTDMQMGDPDTAGTGSSNNGEQNGDADGSVVGEQASERSDDSANNTRNESLGLGSNFYDSDSY